MRALFLGWEAPSFYARVRLCGVTLHALRIYRVTKREPHAVLGCYLVRGIGYSWECRCGERGDLWKTWREARFEGIYHADNTPAPPVTADLPRLILTADFPEDAAGVTD